MSFTAHLFSKSRHISTLTWHLLHCNTPWQQCPQTAPHRLLWRTERDENTHEDGQEHTSGMLVPVLVKFHSYNQF